MMMMTMVMEATDTDSISNYTLTFCVASLLLICLPSLFRMSHHRRNSDHRHGGVSVADGGVVPRSQTDVIIVGAGVAGSALAYNVAKDGRRVHVIERDLSEPDRMSGEVLHPGGYLKLIELGLVDCVDNIDAQRVIGYDFSKDGKSMRLSCPLEQYGSDVAGRGFHNGRFVQRMREKAAAHPNVRLEQGTVTSLVEKHGIVKGVHYKTQNGEEISSYAPLTIVCDGCCSNLRQTLCSPEVEVSSHLVGLVLKNCQMPSLNHGHIVIADPSLVLFYPIGNSEVRCLIDVATWSGQKLPSVANGEMAKYLKTVVAPKIPPELYEHFVTAVDEGNIRTLPTRTMPATPQPTTPGALLVGDAFNMRHAFTGGGMTVALSDVVILRDLLRQFQDLDDSVTVSKYLESFYTLRKPMASTINTLAHLFYKIFCASPDEAHKELSDTLFDYLSLGGECSTGPTALLFGLTPRPMILMAHLIAVAVYGFGRLLLPFPSPKRLWLAIRLLKEAGGIVFPMLRAEGLAQMFIPAILAVYNK